MTPWTEERERRAIRAHLRRCRFCRALRGYGEGRADSMVLAAAGRLAGEHAANDAERELFARGSGLRLRPTPGMIAGASRARDREDHATNLPPDGKVVENDAAEERCPQRRSEPTPG